MTASAAFVLSGAVALVLAFFADGARLELGGIAALSGAIALVLLAVGRRPDPPPIESFSLRDQFGPRDPAD